MRKITKLEKGVMWVYATVFLVLITSIAAYADEPKLIGAFFVKGKVGLNWQKVKDVSEYSVFRKSADEEYQKIGVSEKNHYFDTDLTPGAVYTYKISTTQDDTERFSNEKTVTIPGQQEGEFKVPTWSGLRVDRNRIFLNWDAVPGAMAYNVYRSASSGGDYEVIGNAQTSKYADNLDLERGQTYFYVVTALNAEFEETEYSKERSIKFGMSKEEMDAALEEENKIELIPVKLSHLFDIKDTGREGPMNQPAELAINSEGDIFITDALNARVHCFESNGKHKFSFGEKTSSREADNPPPGSFAIPFSIFIDKNDKVYVSDIDNHDIQVFDAKGNFIKRIRVDTGPDMEELRPNGIHVLDDGRIVVTDAGNHRFLIIDQDGKILLSKGEKGSDPGQFVFADGITVTKDNTICVVDVINCRIQEFDLDGNFIRAFGSVGKSAGTFGRPKVITTDDKGQLWISDGMSHIIQGFSIEGEIKSALGTVDDEVKFSTPRGILFKDSKLYVVNRLKNKVSVYKIG